MLLRLLCFYPELTVVHRQDWRRNYTFTNMAGTRKSAHTPNSAQWWLSGSDLLRFTAKTSIHEGTERAPKSLWKEIALHLLVCFMVFSRESVTFHSLAGNRAGRKPMTTSGCDFRGEIWNAKRCRSTQDDGLWLRVWVATIFVVTFGQSGFWWVWNKDRYMSG